MLAVEILIKSAPPSSPIWESLHPLTKTPITTLDDASIRITDKYLLISAEETWLIYGRVSLGLVRDQGLSEGSGEIWRSNLLT